MKVNQRVTKTTAPCHIWHMHASLLFSILMIDSRPHHSVSLHEFVKQVMFLSINGVFELIS